MGCKSVGGTTLEAKQLVSRWDLPSCSEIGNKSRFITNQLAASHLEMGFGTGEAQSSYKPPDRAVNITRTKLFRIFTSKAESQDLHLRYTVISPNTLSSAKWKIMCKGTKLRVSLCLQ